MNFKKLNNYTGWLIFALAFIVYALTVERTASFWDCGEFISASYKLQVVHPPGAPLFLLLGNFFSHFATNPERVAFMVNMLSVLTSALCVLFTFWTITHFAGKLVQDRERSSFLILASGVVGALALTFSDTFWFSANEAEVYASSSFFTALTFWCILKWEHKADEPLSDRWLLLIAYLIGLGIGVHLLNLLVIPAIVYVVYFKRFNFSYKGLVFSTLIGLGILGVVQVGIIPGLPTLASKFDIYFVNDLGMGFGSGVLVFSILVLAAWLTALVMAKRKGNYVLHVGLLAFAFVVIGYSSYSIVIVRSLANPPIDMNNPEDPINLVSYLNREQYGDRPLLKGPYFNAKAVGAEPGKQPYRKGQDAYEEAGPPDVDYEWDKRYVTTFPRMGDMQKETSPRGYAKWSGASEDKPPTFRQNMRFFWDYQLGHMYWRYFMWNFAGRQNDIQGHGGPLNGNWMSGIDFIDNRRLGPQDNLPPVEASNKSRNHYYFFPLILGLLGIIYQAFQRKEDFFIMMVLFLFTGILIAVYLNAPPFEPRERDYTLVGSFQIFCIWIGLGVMQFKAWLDKVLADKLSTGVAAGVALLAVPILMGFQNWDDHDRSERSYVTAFARDYLSSCDSNAILFTNGDNDTYPLWYVQNVEGFRTDVRVVNMQLLNFEWYVHDLTRKIMDSEPFELSVGVEAYKKGKHEQVSYINNPNLNIDQNQHYDFAKVLKFITNEDNPSTQIGLDRYFGPKYAGYKVNYLPTKNLSIAIDKSIAINNGTLSEEEAPFALDRLNFTIPANSLLKAHWVVLDLVMNNQFKRPIYFASNSVEQNFLGLGDYFRLDGLAYRLIPAKLPSQPGLPLSINEQVLYNRLMDKFDYAEMDDPEVLMDEQVYRMARTFRNYFGILATKLAIDNKNDSALKVVNKCMEAIPFETIPVEYGQVAVPILRAAYMAGDSTLGDRISQQHVDYQVERMEYLSQYRGKDAVNVKPQLDLCISNLQEMKNVARVFKRDELLNFLNEKLPENGQ